MIKVVIDSSAFLAVSYRERGYEQVLPLLKQAALSSVNYSEILGKLLQKGMPLATAQDQVHQFVGRIVPYDERLAIRTAELLLACKSLGLSLGDRACLALALHLKLPVMTADQNWSKLSLGIEIRQVRPISASN